AELTWDSEATGDGSLRLEAAEPPRRLTVALAYQQGRITARDTLELAPLPGGGTRVTWSERGSLGHTLLGRLSVPGIEESMGRDLERGLEGLRRVVEGEAPGELWRR
ncbi:MAG TPA: SRPBCC family protein, partial [Thermoanaerobaculia bacterium]|nr:SRPBCC family protein [Thermoanaerobaculia bacterium]